MRIFYSLFFLLSFSVSASVEITQAEVKIHYPCDVLKLLKLGEEKKEIIWFYEKGDNEYFTQGISIRKRGRGDINLKFRPKDNLLNLNQAIFDNLSISTEGRLKCEADIAYDPGALSFPSSCSFTSPGKNLVSDHYEFLKMVKLASIKPRSDLSDLREIKVAASSWMYKHASLERWTFNGVCLLEVSAKVSAKSEIELKTKARKTMLELKKLIPATPAEDQRNKTARVLHL